MRFTEAGKFAGIAVLMMLLPSFSFAADPLYQLSQPQPGFQKFRSSSSNYQFDAEVGYPYIGLLESENYVLDTKGFVLSGEVIIPQGGTGGDTGSGGGGGGNPQTGDVTENPQDGHTGDAGETSETGNGQTGNSEEGSTTDQNNNQEGPGQDQQNGNEVADSSSGDTNTSVGSGSGSGANDQETSGGGFDIGKTTESTVEVIGQIPDVLFGGLASISNNIAVGFRPVQKQVQILLEELPGGSSVAIKTAQASAAGVVPVAASVNYWPTLSGALQALTNGDISTLWLYLEKLWYLLAAILGLKKRPRYFGTVYDSKTKQPLDPVLVKLIDAGNGAVVEQAITDMAGRYGFLAKPGKYRILASKTHYQFPSARVTGSSDEIFDHLYHGEIVEIKDETGLLLPNIPMDPLAFDWNQEDKKRLIKFHPFRQIFFHALLRALFWIGFVSALLVALAQPTPGHLIPLAVYLLVVAFHIFNLQPKLWGRVYSSKTHACLSGLMLELMPMNLPVTLAKAQSADDGKYFLKAPPGQYRLAVNRAVEGKKVLIETLEVVVGKIGMYTADLSVPIES